MTRIPFRRQGYVTSSGALESHSSRVHGLVGCHVTLTDARTDANLRFVGRETPTKVTARVESKRARRNDDLSPRGRRNKTFENDTSAFQQRAMRIIRT